MPEAEVGLLILSAEDYTGLWDAVFEVSEFEAPEEVARDLLLKLVKDGLICIFVGVNPALSPPRRLSRDAAVEALAPGPQWAVPQEGGSGELIFFFATEAGISRLDEVNWGQS